jgi:hypothetical protein
VFDFRNNQLTDKFVDGIKDVVEKSPVRRFDLRRNAGISADEPRGPKFMIGDEESGQRYAPGREAELEEENQTLKKDLTELTGEREFAELSTDLYAIRERVGELIQHINALNALRARKEADRITHIEDGPQTLSTPTPRKTLKHEKVSID